MGKSNESGRRASIVMLEYEREGKNFWSEVLEQAREGASGGRPQPGAWTFMSTNGKENNLCSDKKMGG